MTNTELEELFAKHSQRVSVSCDNEHAHTALMGCLSPKAGVGDERDVIICKLCEVVQQDRQAAKELLTKVLGEG